MTSRRQFLRLIAATLPAAAAYSLVQAEPQPPNRVWLPLAARAMPADDAPILGPASGSMRQAFDWLLARTTHYTAVDVARIVRAYARLGAATGLDWFMALAQLCHETGSLTSWWSQRPRRNPAGIGVTGETRAGTPDAPPGPNWVWHNGRWEAGFSYPSWADHAAPAHLGLLLAYTLRDDHADDAQLTLIAQSLGQRRLGALRGIARTYTDLNGRWAVPGTVYGQRITILARQMRAAVPAR